MKLSLNGVTTTSGPNEAATHDHSLEGELGVNLKLISRSYSFAGVDDAIGEEEKESLLEAFSRQLVQTSFSNENLK